MQVRNLTTVRTAFESMASSFLITDWFEILRAVAVIAVSNTLQSLGSLPKRAGRQIFPADHSGNPFGPVGVWAREVGLIAGERAGRSHSSAFIVSVANCP
jgi:hypothetical protein